MTRPRSRRDLVRTGAVALGVLAGCIGGGDDPDTGTPTTRPTTEGGDPTTTGRSPTTSAESREVEFTPTSVQSSFFYRTATGALDVGAAADAQFAFVEVRPLTDSPPPSDFALVADGRHFWGSLAPGGVGGPHRLVERGRGYQHDAARPGWVAFEVPDPLDAESVVLTYDGRERPVGEDFLDALRAPPPDFQLIGFGVPDRVTPGESFEVSVAVKNVGEGASTFRACLDVAKSEAPSRKVAAAVPASERREWTRTLDARVPASDDQVGVRFASAAADRDAAVELRSETTTD